MFVLQRAGQEVSRHATAREAGLAAWDLSGVGVTALRPDGQSRELTDDEERDYLLAGYPEETES